MHLLTRRPLIVALLLPLLAILAGIVWMFWIFSWQPAWDNYTHRLPFDSAAWKAQTADEGMRWPTRLRMVDDLMASVVLPGKSREQVRAVLGDDDSSAYDTSRGILAYVLGPERGPFGIDYETLVIGFDKVGRVTDMHIATD